MQKEKGITLVSLVIMIIIMAILVGTAVYSGTQSLQETKKTRFITELRMIQEKIRLPEYDNAELGEKLGDAMNNEHIRPNQVRQILISEGFDITAEELEKYRYLTKEELKRDLQLSDISRNVLINFDTKDVISEQGIKVDRNLCYTLRQVGVSDYVTQFKEEEMKGNVDFEIKKAHEPDTEKVRDKWKVTLTQIKMENYPQKYETYYRKYDATQSSDANWMRMENNQALIEGGTYEFKVVDSYKNEKIKKETFPYFPPLGGVLTYKIGSMEEGYVVADDKGNEYVWIPVDGIYGEDGTDITNKVLLGRYEFNTSGIPKAYTGAYKEQTQQQHKDSGYTNMVATNIESFKDSVRKYKGYYIARYEASKGSNNKAESKASVEPWDMITQREASAACQGIYPSFTSDLINSYAWDTAILFIQQRGNKPNSKTYSQESGKNTVRDKQPTGASILETTKERDEQCHIFDMAGNCLEYSTETTNETAKPSTFRGDSYYWEYNNASNRAAWSANDKKVKGLCFRSILYFNT